MRLGLLLFLLGLLPFLVQSQEPNAGIFFRLNQKAIDYISDLAADALPQLLNKLSPPNFETDEGFGKVMIYDNLIHEVTKPSIQTKFVDQKGLRTNITLPYIRAAMHVKLSTLFGDYSGGVLFDIHNLTINMEIHYTRDEITNTNIIEASYCNVSQSEVNFIVPKNSEIVETIPQIKDKMISSLKTTVCQTSIEALRYIDQQNVEEASTTVSSPEASDPHSFNIAEVGASLCKTDSLTKEEDVPTSTSASPDLIVPSASWSPNLTLVYPPQFTDDDVVFGIDGGIMLNGRPANNVNKPNTLNTSLLNEKMIGIMISEYIPNTLLSHVFDNGLGTIHERFVPDNLPKFMRKIGRMMCAKCYLDIFATLTEKPIVEIQGKLGARVLVSGNITINFQGREGNYNLIHANTSLHMTLKPTIRHSRVYGDVSLTSVDVNVFELAMGGMLAGPLEKVTSFIVPKILWPQVKKRLRFALNRRGIQLPVMCGVELEHLFLSYVDHAVVLNTDFNFNLPLFVEKFKIYLAYKSTLNENLPKYIH